MSLYGAVTSEKTTPDDLVLMSPIENGGAAFTRWGVRVRISHRFQCPSAVLRMFLSDCLQPFEHNILSYLTQKHKFTLLAHFI